MVDSSLNEDSKYLIFFQGGPILREGQQENLGEMGNSKNLYRYGNQGVVNFEREY